MNVLQTMNRPARQRGTTLIELSVVIAVLLLLVGVLFIGITAWKNGANTAACIVNLSSMQKAARGYQNLNQLSAGSSETSTMLANASFWASTPVCPGGGTYAWAITVPIPGAVYTTCTLSASGHVPSTTSQLNW